MKSIQTTALVMICGFGLSACSQSPSAPIVDGVSGPAFQQDVAECRQVAGQKKMTGKGRNTGAVIGGIAGAAEADKDDRAEGLVAGVIIGGLFGAAEEKSELDDAREQIVFHCLRGRGHNVVG